MPVSIYLVDLKASPGTQTITWFMLTTAFLIILGGISFVVVYNLFHSRGIHKSSMDFKTGVTDNPDSLASGTLIVY